MIQFEDSEHIVAIEDAFVEDIIKIAKRWKERIKEDIETYIVKEVVDQMEDDSKFIRVSFEVDGATAREIGIYTNVLSLIINKADVTLRNKWKRVRIKKGSLYEKLNDNQKFIEALTRKYNIDSGSYMYYLPVRYNAHLVSKDESKDDFMDITVDIPFSDIEFCG